MKLRSGVGGMRANQGNRSSGWCPLGAAGGRASTVLVVMDGSGRRGCRILAACVCAAKRPATNGSQPARTDARRSRAGGNFLPGPGEYTPRTAACPTGKRHARRTLRADFRKRCRARRPRRLRRCRCAHAAVPAAPRCGLPLRAAVVGLGGGRGRRDPGRVRAPSRPRRRLRCRARTAPAVAPRHRAQLRPPARRASTPATCPSDDELDLAEAPDPPHDEALDGQRDARSPARGHRRVAAALPRRPRAGRARRALVCRSRRDLRLRAQHRALAALPRARAHRARCSRRRRQRQASPEDDHVQRPDSTAASRP